MPAATPSQARITNVILAMKAAGMEPGKITVNADGGFTIIPKNQVDEVSSVPDPVLPRKWGQKE